jgi:hypothetical protein
MAEHDAIAAQSAALQEPEPSTAAVDSPEDLYMSGMNGDDDENAFDRKTKTSLSPGKRILPSSCWEVNDWEDNEDNEEDISILTEGTMKPTSKVFENFTVPFNERGSLYFDKAQV